MYSGQSEEDVRKIISKGGDLYHKYADKKRLMAFVYADVDKDRSKCLIRQFFSQIHYISGVDMDFFWIGYRSRSEFKKSDLDYLREVEEISIAGTSESIPRYFESEVFHRHDNFYQTQNQWGKELNNSSFYLVFYETYDGIPNLDNAYVVNFFRKSAEDDEKFMFEFVGRLRMAIVNKKIDITLIENLLDGEINNKFSNRLFKVIRTSSLLLLEAVISSSLA